MRPCESEVHKCRRLECANMIDSQTDATSKIDRSVRGSSISKLEWPKSDEPNHTDYDTVQEPAGEPEGVVTQYSCLGGNLPSGTKCALTNDQERIKEHWRIANS